MPVTPEVSVVVATHNRALRLAQLLAGLRRQTLALERFEVIVVDDGSSDATQNVLTREARRGELRLCIPPAVAHAGPASARNRGWQLARAPVVAFTDDDCVPTPTWLETLLRAARSNPNAIVRGRTLPNPAEAHSLGSFAKTVSINAPSPHFETSNVAYPRRPPRAHRRLRRVLHHRCRRGLRPRLPRRGRPAARRRSSRTPSCTTRCSRAGRRAALRDALLATDGVGAYKRNPGLRRNLTLGVFYDRSHPLLLAAGAGPAHPPRTAGGRCSRFRTRST